MFLGENDRVKLMLLYSGDEEDARIVRAASGCLAMLSNNVEVCQKITTVSMSLFNTLLRDARVNVRAVFVLQCSEQWQKILTQLAACEHIELQHRGVYIIYNIMCASKDLAAQVVASTMFEVLMALSKTTDDDKEHVRELAANALDKALEWELIKPNLQQK